MFKIAKIMLVVMAVGIGWGASAAPWAVRGNKYRIDTLVITGNYKSPRLMAELILHESRQPYMLVPANNAPGQYNFLVLAKSKRAIPVSDAKFNYLVRNTGARRIIILGDSRYVPEKYEELLDHKIPVIRIVAADWNRVADELTYMLNLSTLKSQYRELRQELVNDSYYYRPRNPRMTTVKPVAPAPKKVAPAAEVAAPAPKKAEAPAQVKAPAPAKVEAKAEVKAAAEPVKAPAKSVKAPTIPAEPKAPAAPQK